MFKFNLKRLSTPNLAVIVLCMVAALIIIVLSIVNNNNLRSLQFSVETASRQNDNIPLLQSTNQQLLLAENNYRLYLATYSTDSRDKYVGYLNGILVNIDSLQKRINDRSLGMIERNVEKHKKISANVALLKKKVDSLLTESMKIKNKEVHESKLLVRKLSRTVLKQYFTPDSVSIVKQKRKGFFGRLKDAFNGGESDSAQIKIVKGALQNEEERKQDFLDTLGNEINDYYQKMIDKQLLFRKRLNLTEQNLATTSLDIISSIKELLQSLADEEQRWLLKQKEKLAAQAKDSNNSIRNVTIISLLVILLFTAILVYTIFKANRYEKELIDARLKAEKLSNTKSRFLSNMSHEIRSPLTAILGFAEQLQKTTKEKQNKDFTDAIKESSEHLLHTVNDILDFSKLEAGKLTLENKSFKLKKTLDETIFIYSLQAEKKGISLKANYTIDEDFQVQGDVFRLKQVLFNLVSNAIKFTDAGSVELNCKLKKNDYDKTVTATIAVKDTGVGIPAKDIEKVFEEFVQSNSDDKDGDVYAGGTGLGLSITKMLVKLLKGNIKAESKVGAGSVFTISIPFVIAKVDDAPKAKTLTIIKEAAVSSNKKILLVEDNEMNVMLFSLLLTNNQFEFDVAMDGEEALAKLNENKYHLLLTDINLPKMSGLELTKNLRNHTDKQKANMSIIAITANVMQDNIDSYFKGGINDYVTKPVKEEEFVAKIRKYLG